MKITEFWAKLAALPREEPRSDQEIGCLPWRSSAGEVKLNVVNLEGRVFVASRFILESSLGRPIRAGMWACHHCDYGACLESSHIYEGTPKQNSADAKARNRLNPPRGENHWTKLDKSAVPRGDLHWSRREPARVARGDKSGPRKFPERYPRGDAHRLRLHPEQILRGEDHGVAKFTELTVSAMRKEYAAGGVTHRELSRKYGVSVSHVGGILRKKYWKHV